MRNIFTKVHALFLLTVLGWLVGQNKSFGQTASQYGFTAVAGTYTAITGGTQLATVQSDDNTSGTFPIGFNFNYCGTVYTSVKANANCWITFGTTTSTTWTNSTADLNTIKPALMPFWDDVAGWVTGTNASNFTYITTGTAPNQVFTIQYKNWQFPRNSSTTPPTYNLQVKLYETTNVIEYIYERIPPVTTGTSGVTIGIGDGAGTPTFLTLNNSSATPTASSTTFTTTINDLPATGQIYRWTPPANCSVQTGMPTSATTTVTPGNVCYSQAATLAFVPNIPMPPTLGLTYQWQSAPAVGGPWTNLANTTVPTYSVSPVASPFYRCQLICNATTTLITTPASAQVVVINPGTPTTTPGARCGPGTVNLTATPAGTAGIRWFNSLTQTIPISTNNTYSTPYLTQNTTYYAASVLNGSNATYNVGLPNFIQTNNFITNTAGWGLRFTVTSTCNVDSVAVYPIGTGTIQMRIWDAVSQAVVYTGPVSPSMTGTGNTKTMVFVGANALPPGSYVMGIAAFTGLTNLHNEGFNASAYPFTSPVLNITAGSQGFGGAGTPNVYYFSYDWKISAIGGCEGPRVPVVATINSSPIVGKAFPAVVCNNKVATITLTQPTPAYPSYNWTPIGNLYTNAAGTTPYAGGSAPTIYAKTTNVGQQTYFMMAGDPTIPTGCTYADTIKIWVQPDSVRIKGLPDSICISGNSILSLVPNTGYAANSIQWQESTTGTASTYANIIGATGTSYTTPPLTANHYYRALIKSTNDTCQMAVKYMVVANPTLLGATDSFNCGPGTVTLKALTGGNSSPVWYDVPTGGNPVGSGSPFVTPSLSTSTVYYVTASGGPALGTKVVGAGALTSGTQTYNPFASGWGGTKIQYLVRATELLAAGLPAGCEITSLGMDVVAAGSPAPGFSISMKNTASTVVTATYEAGTNTVFPATNVTPTANALNNYIFATPFQWDGTSNVLIQMCWSNGTTNTTPGNTVKGDVTTFVATHRGQSDSQTPAAMCGLAAASTNTTYSNRPKFTFGGYIGRCETPRQLVHANIYPKPAVDLGPDVNICADAGSAIVLDAGVQPNTPSFLWDNGTTSQVRAVNSSGTYNVKVTNSYTCVGSDTVDIVLRKNPVVHLGDDTIVCNGVVLTLNPGGGSIEYFWNTGQTGQTIDVNSPGTYSVFVTNAEGCTVSDTIQVTMQGELPTIQGIQVSNNGIRTFHFTAVLPQNVIGYDWDFGDGSLHSYEVSPSHTYDSVGDFIVVLHLSSTCGFANDTMAAHIVGIHQLNVNNAELTVYPNPSNGQATILNKGDLKMEKIEVYNILGQVVYRSKADSKDKHVINLSNIASGIYTIEVYTDKGTVARKLEIIK